MAQRSPLLVTPDEAKLVLRAVNRAMRPVRGSGGIKVSETDKSLNLSFTRTQLRGHGRAGAGGAAASPFRIKEIWENVLVCRTWDGTSDGDTNIYVAKPYLLQQVESHYPWIDGSSLTSVNTQEITVEVSSIEYTWRVTLPYAVNEVIWATPYTLGDIMVTTTEVVWMDDNRNGHAWGEVQ